MNIGTRIGLGVAGLTLGSGVCSYASYDPEPQNLLAAVATSLLTGGLCMLIWGLASAIRQCEKE